MIKKISLSIIFLACISILNAQGNQTDAKGKKQGSWVKYYPNTKIAQYKGQFKDNVPVGVFTYYYKTGQVEAVITHINSKRSEATFYHDNGNPLSKGIYINMKKDSIWEFYVPSGRLSYKETYKQDVLDGVKTIYYVPEDLNDKSRNIFATEIYSKGILHGERLEYFNTGIPKQRGVYVNGKKNGEWKTFQPDGKIETLERYIDDDKHGWFTIYDENGNEKTKVYYFHGRRVEGEELKKMMQTMKEKGINPNGNPKTLTKDKG